MKHRLIYAPLKMSQNITIPLKLSFGLLIIITLTAFILPVSISAKELAPIQSLGMNKYSIAFSHKTNADGDYDHVFNIRTMSLDDARLSRLRFRKMKKRHGEYSLTFPLNHNNHAILDLRQLGSIIVPPIDWTLLEGRRHNVFGFLRNSNWLSGGESGTLYLYNVQGEKLASLVGHSGTVTALASYDNWAVSGDDDGLIILWNMDDAALGRRTLKPYIRMACSTGGEWIVWSDEGYFSASNTGRNVLSQLSNHVAADLQNDPELLIKKLTNPKVYYQSVNLRALGYSKKIPLPTVRFLNSPSVSHNRDIKIQMELCDNGGGIELPTMFLRGTSITLYDSSRGVTLQEKSPNGFCYPPITQDISLLEGENKLVLIASNVDGKEAVPATTTIRYEKEGKTKRRLHVVAVAVSEYPDPKNRLIYPEKDAKAILNAFKRIGLGLFEYIETYSIFNEKVTKTELSDLFSMLEKRITKDDMFILFVAGHGINTESEQYHFLPYNTDTSSMRKILETSLNQSDFEELLSKIRAEQSLILIDTCSSGAFKGFDTSKSGRALLMASSEDQVAYEGYKGHGVFTHFILEGLKGKADGNDDTLITVDELSIFVSEHLASLTERRYGFRQETTRSLTGHNFVIGKY